MNGSIDTLHNADEIIAALRQVIDEDINQSVRGGARETAADCIAVLESGRHGHYAPSGAMSLSKVQQYIPYDLLAVVRDGKLVLVARR